MLRLGTTFFGPFVLVPAAMAASTAAFGLHVGRVHRVFAVLVACLVVSLPVVLEATGVIAASYRFTREGMLLLPQALELPATATLCVLTSSSLGVIITGAIAGGRVRDALAAAERRLHLQSWHVRQFLPDQAGARQSPRAL